MANKDTSNSAPETDYARGWADCRGFRGEALGESAEYRRGFDACLRAYHLALASRRGWDAVPAVPV